MGQKGSNGSETSCPTRQLQADDEATVTTITFVWAIPSYGWKIWGSFWGSPLRSRPPRLMSPACANIRHWHQVGENMGLLRVPDSFACGEGRLWKTKNPLFVGVTGVANSLERYVTPKTQTPASGVVQLIHSILVFRSRSTGSWTRSALSGIILLLGSCDPSLPHHTHACRCCRY